MSYQQFRETKFRPESSARIKQINDILAEYTDQKLTARQVYYQLVSRDIISNDVRSYKNLTNLLTDARYAGLVDWDVIEDRGREPDFPPEWSSLESLIESALHGFRLPRWEGQENYVELWCFPPETSIIGDGWVAPIASIKAGDCVLTREGERQMVTNTIRREYSGKLVAIKATGLLEFRSTPNHPILVKRLTSPSSVKGAKKRFSPPEYAQAGELKKGDLVMVPRKRGEHLVPKLKTPTGPRSRSVNLLVDELFCRCLGLYLAEGCVRSDGRTIQFTFGSTEEDFADLVEEWASRLGLGSDRRAGKGTIIVLVYGKTLASWLEQEFGNGSFAKRLAGWVMRLPEQMLLTILEYHFKGDGSKPCKTHPGLVFNTRSHTLASQEHLALLQLGLPATIGLVADHEQPMYRVNLSGAGSAKLASRWGFPLKVGGRTFNHVLIDEEYAYFPIRKLSSNAYRGEVFNLTVKGSHSYCVPCVVHNCEKQALAGVLAPIASKYHVTLMVNKGYSSASAMKDAADRMIEACDVELGSGEARGVILLYLGDHDPSGEDMVRDIGARLEEFGVENLDVQKLALTMEQVKKFKPPPNPAKLTDSRAAGYIEKFGLSSWELDALPPRELNRIIEKAILGVLDYDMMKAIMVREEEDKQRLRAALKEM